MLGLFRKPQTPKPSRDELYSLALSFTDQAKAHADRSRSCFEAGDRIGAMEYLGHSRALLSASRQMTEILVATGDQL